VGNLGY